VPAVSVPRSNDPNVYMVDLLVDDKTALATPSQFDRLMEYSTSLPTGQYSGKRWKARCRDGSWMLGEFTVTPTTPAGFIDIIWRELLVV
jgi:hypothetical protein